MRVSKRRLAASRTGCLASPNRSTTAGTSALNADGGGVERLKRALRDLEAAVLQEIQTAFDERSDFRGTEAPPRSFENLVEALHAGHPLLRVLGACEFKCFIHRGASETTVLGFTTAWRSVTVPRSCEMSGIERRGCGRTEKESGSEEWGLELTEKEVVEDDDAEKK
ncbi:hypothetical protein V8G54_029999 [Vigna mungo]|uniref:Uncharacterized protein n=1 Tax=Vigna mungo TaxID=3915 RepID=A0AAQ3RJP7_VIGMU